MDFQNALPRIPLSPLLLRTASFWQRHTRPVGKLSERLSDREVFVLHKKRENIPPGAAPETVIHLLTPRDRKRGRFFIVKRTESKKITAAFFQIYIGGYDIDNITALPHFLHNIFAVIHVHLPVWLHTLAVRPSVSVHLPC